MVTIIIPIHNAEHTILRCLESVRKQSYRDFEVIIIDDGSTDGSSNICDVICKEDSRFKLYQTEKKGVSAARNLGIRYAQGEWIAFIDGDDYICDSFLSVLVSQNTEESLQVIICDYFIDHQDKIERNSFFSADKEFCSEDKINLVKKSWGINSNGTSGTRFGVSWAKLYRKSYIDEIEARFPNQIEICEDIIFNTRVFGEINRCKYVHEPLYHYVINYSSSTHRYMPNINEIARSTVGEAQKALNAVPCVLNTRIIIDLLKIKFINKELNNYICSRRNSMTMHQRVSFLSKECEESFYKSMIDGPGEYFDIRQRAVKALLQLKLYKLVIISYCIKRKH